MPARHARAIPVEVERVRRRIERWRAGRARGTPLPPALWVAAAKAAELHGVSRTTRVLGLDYYKLKARMPAEAAAGKPARFVELTPPAPVAQCRIEIERPAGTRITIELPVAAGAELAIALCQTVGGIAR